MGLRKRLIQFHRVMRVPIHCTPIIPTEDRIRLRLKLITEEFLELLDAVYDYGPGDFDNAGGRILVGVEDENIRVRLDKMVDALADLDYVIEGTRLEFGVHGKPIAKLVHEANMRKAGGPIREDGKILKPDDWKPPDIYSELKRQGF